jgi:hypothetical protein
VSKRPDQSRLIRFFIAFFPDKPDVYRRFAGFSGKLVENTAFSNNSIHDGWPIVMDNRARFGVDGL